MPYQKKPQTNNKKADQLDGPQIQNDIEKFNNIH